MARVLVLYYSAYGHIETMAHAVAEGARSAGAEVAVKRVPELVPEDVAKASHFKLDQPAPVATVEELADYDAIIFGAGTRYGTVASQLRNFIDQTGGLWAKGKLVGKVGSAFTSSATQHGGQESTILGLIPTMMHPAWWSSDFPMPSRVRWALRKSRADRPMAPRRSPAVTVRASPPRSNSKPPAFRVRMSRGLPQSSRTDDLQPSCAAPDRAAPFCGRFGSQSAPRPGRGISARKASQMWPNGAILC